MIKTININDIPGDSRNRTSKYSADIAEFLNSGADVAEIFTDTSKSVTNVANSLRVYVSKGGYPVHIVQRKDRIFLIREGKNA